MVIKYMNLEEIQPSQIYICKSKLEKVNDWIDVKNHNYDPIPVKKFDGKYVFTDGHTRALALLQSGEKQVKVCIDEEKLDLELYKECINLCLSNNILNICALNDRIVDCESYEELWYKKCADMYEEIQKNKNICE